MDDYCRSDRPFLLAKLHGSVNWFCHIHAEGPGRQPQWREALHAWDRRVTAIEMRNGTRDVWKIKNSWLFPVLTAPMANKTPEDLVCPPAHLEAVRAALAKATRTLFVGVSGRDADLLTLLRMHLRQQDLVHVVAGKDLAAVNSAAGSLIEGVRMNGDGSSFRAFQLGFSEYSRSRQLQDFMEGRIRQAEGRWPFR